MIAFELVTLCSRIIPFLLMRTLTLKEGDGRTCLVVIQKLWEAGVEKYLTSFTVFLPLHCHFFPPGHIIS